MSVRHSLTLLPALRAKEFSDFYSRTSFVLSSCVPRGPTTPTKQGKVGQEGMKERVSYALVHQLKLFICFTQGASIKLSLAERVLRPNNNRVMLIEAAQVSLQTLYFSAPWSKIEIEARFKKKINK